MLTMGNDFFTPSQRLAWEYVESASRQGMKQVEALRAFRSGGGAIRTSFWNELWHRAEEGAGVWSTMYLYKDKDTLPASMYEPVGVNYKGKYALNVKMNVRLEDGTILHQVYRTLSSDKRLTLGEWKQAIADSMEDDPSVFTTEILQITDMEFFQKGQAG